MVFLDSSFCRLRLPRYFAGLWSDYLRSSKCQRGADDRFSLLVLSHPAGNSIGPLGSMNFTRRENGLLVALFWLPARSLCTALGLL